jgi:hypothetical protein
MPRRSDAALAAGKTGEQIARIWTWRAATLYDVAASAAWRGITCSRVDDGAVDFDDLASVISPQRSRGGDGPANEATAEPADEPRAL